MALKTPTDPKPIKTLLRENETLLPFHRRLRQLSRLQKTFADTLPSGLSESSRIATVEGSTIIVATANGAVAAKLKQMLPRLIEKLRENIGQNKMQDQEVTGISVIVQPEFFAVEKPAKFYPPRVPMPSEKLAELAESLRDSPLKTILQTLQANSRRALANKRKPG